MAGPVPVRASFNSVVLAIKAEMATFLGWDATLLLVVAGRGDVPYRMGDQDIVLRVGGESPDRSISDQAGRIINRRTRTLDVEMRTRVLLDPSDIDLTRLTDSSLGHIALEDRVIDCLECFFPLDSDGNCLVAAPCRVGRLTDPSRDKAHPEWVTSTFSVDVLYDRSLNLTRGL